MLESEIFDRYYNLALRFLSYRPRSEKEVYEYLKGKIQKSKGKSLNGEIIAKIMSRLAELDFVDDSTFVRWWIENRKKGGRLIKLELLQKGISKETIEEALLKFDIAKKENDLIKKFIEKKKSLPYEKLVAYLLRRGFDYETIKKALKQL
ncbi:MAG: RecX family transcriptional regulator [Patescibacteria group bacterium]